MDVIERMRLPSRRMGWADADTPVLLMVSGGSDSTALAYAACELAQAGELGMLAMLHVNHHLRGEDADADAAFVSQLADALAIPLFMCDIDVAGEVARHGAGNVEAVARSERYPWPRTRRSRACAAMRARRFPAAASSRAHTADDRVESFYMRSIVGTGPGGLSRDALRERSHRASAS